MNIQLYNTPQDLNLNVGACEGCRSGSCRVSYVFVGSESIKTILDPNPDSNINFASLKWKQDWKLSKQNIFFVYSLKILLFAKQMKSYFLQKNYDFFVFLEILVSASMQNDKHEFAVCYITNIN